MPLCFVPSAGRLGMHFGCDVLPLASRAVRFVPVGIYFVFGFSVRYLEKKHVRTARENEAANRFPSKGAPRCRLQTSFTSIYASY